METASLGIWHPKSQRLAAGSLQDTLSSCVAGMGVGGLAQGHPSPTGALSVLRQAGSSSCPRQAGRGDSEPVTGSLSAQKPLAAPLSVISPHSLAWTSGLGEGDPQVPPEPEVEEAGHSCLAPTCQQRRPGSDPIPALRLTPGPPSQQLGGQPNHRCPNCRWRPLLGQDREERNAKT